MNDINLCWFCFASLHPEKAKLKVRKEHYILAEFQRRCNLSQASGIIWDCPVSGGCSLKRPDLLIDLPEMYVQVEVDEDGHLGIDCADEDTRLAIISADVGKPGLVLRLNPDAPGFECFRAVTLSNGERGLRATKSFELLMSRAETAVKNRVGSLDSVVRVFIDADPNQEPSGERLW